MTYSRPLNLYTLVKLADILCSTGAHWQEVCRAFLVQRVVSSRILCILHISLDSADRQRRSGGHLKDAGLRVGMLQTTSPSSTAFLRHDRIMFRHARINAINTYNPMVWRRDCRHCTLDCSYDFPRWHRRHFAKQAHWYAHNGIS